MSEEKKLTDEEIVKALEICANWGAMSNCKDCPIGLDWCCANQNGLAKYSLAIIHRLQSENATLKTELRKECEEHEEFTKKAKAEIERLEKDVHDMSWIIKMHKYCVGADHCQNSSMKEFKLQKEVDDWVRVHDEQLSAMQVLTIENKNLQKQVDELKEERENMQAVILGLENKLANVLLGIKADEV